MPAWGLGLEHGATVWDPYLQSDIDKLEQIQRSAARFITGDYRSMTPGSVTKLLTKCNLPPLQERRRHLRLTLFYRVVEGLVPALPPENFLKKQRPGRLIRSRTNADTITNNPAYKFARHNEKPYVVTNARCEQHRNSFFVKTTIEWNRLENNVVSAESTQRFKTLVSATQI